jgi:BirA family biotin operon repressor/biotin-[acetyl-CoA-carboxylase] ligase
VAAAIAAVSERCATIGRRVRIEFPDGSVQEADARGIDVSGRLIVQSDQDREPRAVAAGDVTHLRY